VVCADDEHADYFTAATSRPVVTYGFASGADYRAAELQCETAGSTFRLMTPTGSAACTLPVPGDFNVANALAAAAVAQQLLGVGAEELAGAIGRLRAVRGRMDVVLGTTFSVIVDFAHTPGSFRTVLPFFRERCGGRLIVVFGSAGERDVAKRPLQGQIADEYADLIVLADEDPRGEDRMEILRQIAAGCPDRVDGETILLIPDRREAIRRAFARAKAGDTVLLLGKGHETSIIGASGEQPWDERSVAREELQRLDVLERDG
jgi:UDP-N-acetylmuramoyl-L-alanyl-D-glutamate--2,6-diaminopimelate ligase